MPSIGLPRSWPNLLAEELVEVVMGTDPDPGHGFTGTLPNGAILLIDTNRPDILIPAQFLESQGRMRRILDKEPVRAPCSLPDA